MISPCEVERNYFSWRWVADGRFRVVKDEYRRPQMPSYLQGSTICKVLLVPDREGMGSKLCRDPVG
jgi:hypothetical protein